MLTHHVIPARVISSEVLKLDGKSVKTAEGSTANVKVLGGKVMINNDRVIKADIVCTNGVIHVIDTVLLPPAK